MKDILADYAMFCVGVANQFQPKVNDDGTMTWPEVSETRFNKYMDKACLFAHRAAPYESPTFRAVEVRDMMSGNCLRPAKASPFCKCLTCWKATI